jgi:hypothetical protein
LPNILEKNAKKKSFTDRTVKVCESGKY